MKKLLLLALAIITIPAAQRPPQPQKLTMAQLPPDLQNLISKFALHGRGAPDYQALANMITAMGSLITPEKLISIFESLPSRVMALQLVPYLKHIPVINDKRVQDWFKNIKLKSGEELVAAVQNPKLDRSKVIEMLSNPNININEQSMVGFTALMWAALQGRTEIAQRLIELGADVNLKSDGGLTALMHASEKGRTEIVKLLLAAGAKINEKDRNGATALMWASYTNHPEIVELLLAAGADINEKDREGNTALNIVRQNSLQGSIENPRFGRVIELLEAAEKAQKEK